MTALERTFLGWIRTSGALAMIGCLLAQVAIISERDMEQRMSSKRNSLVARGMPDISRVTRILAAIAVALALVTVTMGAYRHHSGQQGLLDGRAVTGGWALIGIGLSVVGVSTRTPAAPSYICF